jgi:hypothetical protein
MKKFCLIPLLAALVVFFSCQKQQNDEERKAEVERQVQDRLAAERADAEKKRLADERAALDAREKAIADRETPAVAINTPASVQEAPPAEEVTETTEMPTEERSTAAYGMFYEKLDSYGEWRETNDYGYVWQPREAETARDWRPYTEGRWAYSDAGWTWISDEPFGWATYHYGRWVRLRRIGWVWVPGNEWAPAWVSWRTSKDYVGWAPLPPEARFDRRSGIQNWADNYYDIGPDQYAFVSSNDFGAEHIRRSVVPAERNISIVVDTTNVTRITYANTMIMNEGPSYDEYRSRGPRQIERYRLRRERNTEAQARVRGDELEVSVPVLSAVRNIFKPRRVKERVVDVNVDNGWTEIKDRSAVERARTKFRTEATPPPNAPSKKFVRPVETASASATPAISAAPAGSTTPAAPTPRPTAAAVSPTPAASVSPATKAASPTPASTATTAATATPAASANPRVRPSASIRPRPSSTIASPPAASPSSTTAPAATAATSPNATAVTTPAASITPTTRVRPSPSIPPRPVQTPPPIERRTPPSLPSTTPVATAAPAIAPETATTPVVKPTVPVPPVRRPSVSPRPPLPTVTPTDTSSDTARPPVPRDVPRRTMPPRLTPPPATDPVTTPAATITPAASTPPATNERLNNRRRPLPPVPGGTPTPSPSMAP